ncbi:MAG: tetratricopeptide repeat protein [Gammaproteobacteria bacterium]|nr:tetratricopeptide repeat protein [Gammaproteobacteria bacterium]MYH84736.1 tetratricopeptide repeat protein [Gammaproteobacteria bacterium]MYK04454.1 tetratricopeptide repeat protein [Gammaproteobacteria bacterium]
MTKFLTRSMLLTLALMLPLLLSTGAALAQFDDPAPGPDPAQGLTNDSPLYRGEELLQTGSYAAAAEIFQQADGLDRNPGVIGASRALAAMGNLQEAMRICENLIDDDHADFPLVSTQLAEVKRMAGESAEALSILESVIDGLGVQGAPVRTLVQYAGLLQFVGRKPESYVLLEEVVDRYNDGLVFSSPDVAMVALASWMLDRFHDANSLFQEATRADPRNLEAHVLWGDLFLEKYNEGEAERSYADALEINGRFTPALVGMAKITGDERALQRALAINPNSVPAMEILGRILQRSGREEEAVGHFSRALNLNPEALGVLSALASEAAMEERMADYALHAAQVEAFSPNNPIFLADVAEHFGGNYRFTEAVEYARAAIEADPQYWRGYTLLGSNLIRLGEEAEGRANLEIGFENDPFNVLSSNLLTVFDTLEEYATLESEHFLVHMSPRDARILWPYMEAMLEEAWDRLVEKWDFEPEYPVLIEVFENTQDFAVRSVGLPDIGPLVGICFGKVVTLISPDTLSANWQEIAWHEFSHVITLQMTGNRIPRWLSEGISVWEEREGRPYWGRRQGLDLVRAAQNNQYLPISELNAAFSGARSNADLGFAYFQSYLVVDYIEETYGFEKLRELVVQYGLIKEDSERFREVFDVSMNQFDAGFRNWIDRRVAEINVHVHQEDLPDEGEGHGHGIRENSSAILSELYNNASLKQYMRTRLEQNPRDFMAHLQLGIVLFKEESFLEAREALEAAHELLPSYSGYPSPPLVMSQIYEREGNREEQHRWLEILLENLQHDDQSALILAEAALERTDFERAEYYIDRALQVDPYESDVHALRARLADETGNSPLAVTEYEILLELEVSDPVEARTSLAEAYMRNDQPAAAKQQVLEALETAPSYLRAQQVLLQSLDGNLAGDEN